METGKNFELEILAEAESPIDCQLFLFNASEKEMNIPFAKIQETENTDKVVVCSNVSIPAESMKRFALGFLREMIDYEKKYKNGNGIAAEENPDEGVDDESASRRT